MDILYNQFHGIGKGGGGCWKGGGLESAEIQIKWKWVFLSGCDRVHKMNFAESKMHKAHM